MFGFLLAIGAGFVTPQLDKPVAEPLLKAVSGWIDTTEVEVRLVAFMIAMLAAGVASNLLNSGATFWVILGGVLGYFLTRIIAAAKTAIDQNSD